MNNQAYDHYDRINEENDAHQEKINVMADDLYKNATDSLMCEAFRDAAVEMDELLLSKLEQGPQAFYNEYKRQYESCLKDLCRYVAEKELG